MMNERVFVMREAIVRLTQLMAGKGIQVTQRGMSAFVKADAKGKPFLVNLPYIPDNATEELIDAIQGFLDHEVAHILFTDFTLMEQAVRAGTGGMLNLIEDSRIEKAMAKRFQGTAENLDRTGRFFLEKYTEPKLAAAIAAGDEGAIQGLLMVPLMRSLAGQSIWTEYLRDKMHHIQDVYDKLKDLAPKIAALGSTRECLEMAGTVSKRLRDEPPGATLPPDPAAPPTPPTPGKTPKGKPSGAPKPKKDPADPADPADDEEDPADPAGGDPDDGDPGDPAAAPDPDDGSGDVKAGAGAGEESAGDGGTASTGDDGDGSDEDMDIAQSSGISWEDIDKELSGDYDDKVSSVITNSAADSAADADYLIYSTEFDEVAPLKVGSKYEDKMLTQVEDDVLHMVGPLQKDLERAISARSLSSWQPGQRRGRLNPSGLSRLALGDDRVFRTKLEVSNKDVAVELVIDMSGSMGGTKINTAVRAAYALASVLERIGIPCEVICFTTGRAAYDDPAHMSAEQAKMGRNYSRNEALYMPVLKSFNERLTTEVKKRFGWLTSCGDLRNNVDGESVMVAARRLLARREKGKIMMVLSDGAPHASGSSGELAKHLQKTVRDITLAGVNVIGIGIESTEVRRFYPKNMVLNNVSELPAVVMKELRALIVK